MKTIFITKNVEIQDTFLDLNIKIINSKTPLHERFKIYNGFFSGEYDKISITESLAVLGGVRYDKNNDEIQIIFIDDIDDDRKKYIIERMNINVTNH